MGIGGDLLEGLNSLIFQKNGWAEKERTAGRGRGYKLTYIKKGVKLETTTRLIEEWSGPGNGVGDYIAQIQRGEKKKDYTWVTQKKKGNVL